MTEGETVALFVGIAFVAVYAAAFTAMCINALSKID